MNSKTPHLYTHQMFKAPATLAGREHNDCAVKALAVAAGVSYDDAHAFWELHGRKPRRGTFTNETLPYCRRSADFSELGFRATRVGGHSTRYNEDECGTDSGWVPFHTTLRAFCRSNPQGSFIVCVAHHALAVVDGTVVDYTNSDLRRIRDVWKIERL